MEKINTGKSSSAAGPKEHRWALFECGAGERGIQKTYEVRAVVFQFLESTRSGTPRDPWMKGEPTPAWDHGTRGSSPGGRASSHRGNVATPETVVFGVGEPGFLQAGRGNAVGKHAQSTTAPPLRSFQNFHSR